MTDSGELVVVLLTGGRSRRMGEDKAFLHVDGEPLWRLRVLELLRLDPAALLISARPGQVFDAVPDKCEVVYDRDDADGALPALARLLAEPPAGLPRLVVPVDMPELGADFLRRAFPASEAIGRAYRWQDRLQPVPALFPACTSSLAGDLASTGERSLQVFCRECENRGLIEICDLASQDGASYLNLNRPDDFKAWASGKRR